MEAPQFAAVDFRYERFCISGGAPLPQYIIAAYQDRGVVFRQGHGLTEAGVNCLAMTDADSGRKPGSIGKPMMFTQAKIIGPNGNELVANPANSAYAARTVSRGYWEQRRRHRPGPRR